MTNEATEADRATVLAAGLERASQLFPEDVAAAAAEARMLRKAYAAPLQPEDGPWEPPR